MTGMTWDNLCTWVANARDTLDLFILVTELFFFFFFNDALMAWM